MPTFSASTRDASVCQDLPEHDVETALLHALGPFGDASNKENVQLQPSVMAGSGSSPTKQPSSPLRPMSSHSLNDVKIPPPTHQTFPTDSPQKKADFYPSYPAPSHAHPAPSSALWGSFPSAQPSDKENYFDAAPFIPPMAYGEADYGYKGPAKRSLDTAPLKDRNAKKQKVEIEEPIDLPDPKDMPPVHDDGTKPIHSYAELIGMAILRAPQRRLTLAQIYKWISDHFSFYKSTESGWQNSIRHNLSLNKNFIKQERPKDDPGKGNYWAIKPGEERPYLLGKKNPIRRVTNPDGSQYIQGIAHGIDYRPPTAPAIGHFTLAPNPRGRAETSKAADTAKFPDDADLSSDGTIPASDPALQEDEKDDVAAMPPPSHIRSSPPPADIGSSPPPMLSQPRKDTPPPVPRFPSTSRSGNRRQKFAGLNDSGYWSSIESSAARGAAHQLTSEADFVRPRIKKGRAEEEIRRMRSSSFDSPSKERNINIKAPTSQFQSSSPMREDNPLTPAVVFKRPAKPPPSISPNTSLLNHRERVRALLGTPAKLFSPSAQIPDWSPAFQNAEDSGAGLTPFISPYKESKTPWKAFEDGRDSGSKDLFNNATFDIFIDAPEEDMTARGSPEKRSARRPSMQRAATSSNILANITGSSKSNRLTLTPNSDSPFSLSPFINNPRLRSPAKLGSPLKQSHQPPSSKASSEHNWDDFATGRENLQPLPTVKEEPADLFGVNLPSDGSEEGIDIFQDFGKIGHSQPLMPIANRANGSPVRRTMGSPARPHLSRASSNRW